MIRFVYFDVAGTLLRPHPSVGEVYARACRPLGLAAAPEVLEVAFRQAWLRRQDGEVENLLAAGKDDRATRAWWRGLVDDVLASVGFEGDRLGCADACYEAFSRPSSWRIFDDVEPALRELRRRGLGTGVLSNWDYRLPALLDALGLSTRFDPILVSALERMRKPERRFFLLACQRAGQPPAAVLHVGDQHDLDLEGARAAGMQALLVDRSAAAPSGAVIRSLAELAERIDGP
jgi:putative hydrolase of the HAD superfamily